jgi:4'-phosphopantetheinyl transferase
MRTPLWHSLGEADLPSAQEWLSPDEARRVSSMRFTKRRTEWLLARWTGKQVLATALSLPSDPASLAGIEIATIIGGDAQGAPWVLVHGRHRAIGVSLTDRAGWAVCMVADNEEIGCDLELVEPRSNSFVQDYLTSDEQKTVASPPFEASPDVLANLMWSAKESTLKVLRTGLRRDTRSVEIALSHATPAHGWRPLVSSTEEGRQFPGWWRRYGSFLLTVVTGVECDPPRPFVEPPPLAAARPSHSWMSNPVVSQHRHDG